VRVAVVGVGAMGARIARRLLDCGHDLLVWNRSRQKLAPLTERGAVATPTPRDAAAQADVLITMLADRAALRAVVQGRDGIAAGAHGSLTVVEMSTVGPAAVAELAGALPHVLDAPVLGSLAEAESGSLTLFVGGPAPLVDRTRPLLAALGRVVHVGPVGAGAAAKLVANATLFTTLAALGEALSLARTLGLSRDAAYEVLAATPLAAQAERRRPAIEADEYPPRFRLALALKDAELVRCAGEDLRVAEAARSWFADAVRAGLGERDYTAVLAAILDA
jgi:3-hydroxyisobutyrate dehydrogenase-like beta-hydroxyacid dehydrogenase